MYLTKQSLKFRSRTRNDVGPFKKIRFEDGVMLFLSSPYSALIRKFSKHQRIISVFVALLVAAMLATTGCSSSLNAGSTSTSKPTQPIAIAASLPPAAVGSPFNAVLSVSGGTAPYNFSIRQGTLPPGLSINGNTGAISGKPMRAGAYSFLVSVLDKGRGAQGVQKFLLNVSAHPVKIAVSPASITMASGHTQQFTAQISNSTNHNVMWWVSEGKITPSGLFTAPNVSAPAKVAMIATSMADLSKNAFVFVNVTAAAAPTPTPTPTPQPSALTITSALLPNAIEGVPYSVGLRAAGGTAPYRWNIEAGSLPSGVGFDTAQGVINGVATQNGPFPVTVLATDSAGQSVARQFSLNVAAASSGNFDGPAELPRAYVKSSLADTPAKGTTILVKTSDAFKTALNTAKCGDTISLQAGATFEGLFVLPAKNCDDAHWIVVRTSAPDSVLPPEGTRLTPCYAGVASLPGRPSFGCAKASNVLAKIVIPGKGINGPLVMANGANHYRLLGLEVSRSTPNALIYDLLSSEKDGTFDHVVIDRSWFHGTAQDETNRGIMLVGTDVAIVDSFFTDFHCVALTGSCGDSQAILGGLGNLEMGPYKIVNNFLEAAGENILFGGGGADKTPQDIEVRHNYFFKPLTWMKGQPGYVGGRDGHAFIVKNHFELKNAARVLFEGNILENTWGGFTQAGFSVLLTPKNQNNHCPICVVRDVTIRYNTVAHAAGGLQIANAPVPGDNGTLGMWNISIHDVIIDDISGKTYNGGSHLIQESNSDRTSGLHNVSMNHVTAFNKDAGQQSLLMVGNNKSFPEMYGFTWTNNLFTGGGAIGGIGGGTEDCTYGMTTIAALLKSCFKDFEFSHNAVVGQTRKWPDGNFVAPSLADVNFATATTTGATATQALAHYQLLPTSPYAHAGSDGKALGADVAAVAAAIAGVK
jgi:putative Ig domain-containing protein